MLHDVQQDMKIIGFEDEVKRCFTMFSKTWK